MIFDFFKRKTEKGFPPKLLPINRMKKYHTHYLGKYDKDKLFWGSTEFTFKTQNEKEIRVEYAILYLFDENGKFQDCKYWKEEIKNPDDVWYKLDEMVQQLDEVKYCNIKIEIFKTIIDGIEFGLRLDEEDKGVYTMPGSGLAFYEPWDGEYYT